MVRMREKKHGESRSERHGGQASRRSRSRPENSQNIHGRDLHGARLPSRGLARFHRSNGCSGASLAVGGRPRFQDGVCLSFSRYHAASSSVGRSPSSALSEPRLSDEDYVRCLPPALPSRWPLPVLRTVLLVLWSFDGEG